MSAVLYVSPHADDVAFSAAGQLAADVADGARATVLTLFEAVDGPADFADRDARRAEDDAFARAFGVTVERAGFVDAIARRRRYRAPQRLFAPLRADEAPLVDEVRAALQARVDAGFRRVVAPLGVGSHVDHQVAHAACRALRGASVRYYEDTPYVLTPYQLPRRLARLDAEVDGPGASDATLARGTVRQELGAAAKTWMTAPLIEDRVGPPLRRLAVAMILTPEWTRWPRRSRTGRLRFAPSLLPASLERKMEAVACYPSQWRLFYRDLEQWRDAIRLYCRAMGADDVVERVWRELTPEGP